MAGESVLFRTSPAGISAGWNQSVRVLQTELMLLKLAFHFLIL
jgi:hypothetical protein